MRTERKTRIGVINKNDTQNKNEKKTGTRTSSIVKKSNEKENENVTKIRTTVKYGMRTSMGSSVK